MATALERGGRLAKAYGVTAPGAILTPEVFDGFGNSFEIPGACPTPHWLFSGGWLGHVASNLHHAYGPEAVPAQVLADYLSGTLTFYQNFFLDESGENLVRHGFLGTSPFSSSPSNGQWMNMWILHQLCQDTLAMSDGPAGQWLSKDTLESARKIKSLVEVRIRQKLEQQTPETRMTPEAFWGYFPGTSAQSLPEDLKSRLEANLSQLLETPAARAGLDGWGPVFMAGLAAREGKSGKFQASLEQLHSKNSILANYLDKSTDFGPGRTIAAAGLHTLAFFRQNGDKTEILPLISSDFIPNGSCRGIMTRGGFAVDLEWKDGKLTYCTLNATRNGTAHLSYQGKKFRRMMEAGSQLTIAPSDFQ